MNKDINIPSTLTNNIIIPNSNQFGNPQRIINYNPNINIQGQFHQVQNQNSTVIQNQLFLPNAIMMTNQPIKVRIQYI